MIHFSGMCCNWCQTCFLQICANNQTGAKTRLRGSSEMYILQMWRLVSNKEVFLHRLQTILHHSWEAHTELKMFAFHYFHRRRIATADLKASSHLGKSQPSASSFGVWALSFWLWSSSGWVTPLAVKDESRTYGLVAFLSYWWNVIWQKVRVSGFCWKKQKYVFNKGGCGKKQDCHKLQTDYIPRELLAHFVWDDW